MSKKIDKTLLNYQDIDALETKKLDGVPMPDNEDEKINLQVHNNFLADNKAYHFKIYKTGLSQAWEQYVKAPHSVSSQNLKHKMYQVSKKVLDRQVRQQRRFYKNHHPTVVKNKKVLKGLINKSLKHTYRKAYLNKVLEQKDFKYITHYQDPASKEYASSYEMAKSLNYNSSMRGIMFDQGPSNYKTPYVHNYVADAVVKQAGERPQNYYIPLKKFKGYVSGVKVADNGKIVDEKHIHAGEMVNHNVDRTPRQKKMTKQLAKKYQFMNTEPLSKLKKQLNKRNVLVNDGNSHMKSANDIFLMNDWDSGNGKLLKNLAEISKYTKHPMHVYVQNVPTRHVFQHMDERMAQQTNDYVGHLEGEYAKHHSNKVPRLEDLMQEPNFSKKLNTLVGRFATRSKYTYLKNTDRSKFKKFQKQMFTPNDLKAHQKALKQINHDMDAAHYYLTGSRDNNTVSLAKAYKKYADHENYLDFHATVANPLHASFKRNNEKMNQQFKKVRDSVHHWLPLVDKNSRSLTKDILGMDKTDHHMYSEEAIDLAKRADKHLPEIKNNRITELNEKFFAKGYQHYQARKNIQHLISPNSIKNHKFSVRKGVKHNNLKTKRITKKQLRKHDRSHTIKHDRGFER